MLNLQTRTPSYILRHVGVGKVEAGRNEAYVSTPAEVSSSKLSLFYDMNWDFFNIKKKKKDGEASF